MGGVVATERNQDHIKEGKTTMTLKQLMQKHDLLYGKKMQDKWIWSK